MEDPPGPGIPQQLRTEMVRRARDKRSRFVEFDVTEPCVWNPTQVLNPQSNLPFTDITAWHYIADQLEGGCAVCAVCLRKPPGKTGYELRLRGGCRTT
jgi:hypothetical protein